LKPFGQFVEAYAAQGWHVRRLQREQAAFDGRFMPAPIH